MRVDLVVFESGDGDIMKGKVRVELGIRNRAKRQLIKEILPTPEKQKNKKEIGDAPLPPRLRLIYLSRFFDRKIDAWFSLHGYPLIRTVHTALAIFNCLSKLVITASEAGAMNTGFAIVPYPTLAGLFHFAHRFLSSAPLFLPRCRGDPSLLSD